MRRNRRPTPGEMRQERADNARDQKREGSMCAYGLCTRPPTREAPDNWSGQYGGKKVCDEHYAELEAAKEGANDA